MKIRNLSQEEYRQINLIARKTSIDYKLEYSKCYSITLLYYLMQFSGLKENDIPLEYAKTVELLYKKPVSSYIHYFNNIIYSNDPYAKGIKHTEIILSGGDDPRCPW